MSSSRFLDPPPEPDIDAVLLHRIIVAICDAGKYSPRCSYPECPHMLARKKAIAAWLVMNPEGSPAAEQPSDESLAQAIERSISD